MLFRECGVRRSSGNGWWGEEHDVGVACGMVEGGFEVASGAMGKWVAEAWVPAHPLTEVGNG